MKANVVITLVCHSYANIKRNLHVIAYPIDVSPQCNPLWKGQKDLVNAV